MIRRHPQRPQRRQFQDFHFFAAPNPVANIDSQFARPPQTTQTPTAIPEPAPTIQPQEGTAGLPTVAAVAGEANVADVIRRSAEFLANIDDPRELIGQPRPAFMDEIEALGATRPNGRAQLTKKSAHSKPKARKTPRSPGRQNRTKATASEVSPSRSPHERHCTICSHPDRAEIEAEFIEWTAPGDIAREYEVNRRAIYRHARAVGLFAHRNGNLRFALGRLIQRVDFVQPTADSIVCAIHAFARINDEGQWIEPPAHVIVSSGGVRREAAASGHRPVAISLDSPAFPSVIDVPPPPVLPAAPDSRRSQPCADDGCGGGALSRVGVLPVTASRVETNATR
ncbi:MAG: hypothetical protein ACRD5K_06130 [Candidatus Acidiferrales bacterium]